MQDPYYTNQYYLEMIGIVDAWDITKGDPAIIMTIVDEPIENGHEDLSFSKVKDILGASIYENDAHGMAVAGIAAADHNSKGIAGIAPNIEIIGISRFTKDGPIDEQILKSYAEDAKNQGSRLFNHSWSTPNPLPIFEQFVENVTNGDLIHVAAAGNFGDPIGAPANYTGMYPVGAIDQSLNRWNYSNFGNELRLMAPNGQIGKDLSTTHPCYVNIFSAEKVLKLKGDIWTLDISGIQGYNPGDYRTTDLSGTNDDCYNLYLHESTPVSNQNYNNDFSGTSANAPMVTGTVALMLSVNPSLTRGDVHSILNNTAIKVPNMGSSNRDDYYGYGMLDAYAAVKEALPNQYDDNTFSSSATITSAHIDGNTTLGSGVTLTIAADEVVVVEGSVTGAATNTHLKVQGKMIVDYDATISRIHVEVEDGGEVLVKPGAIFELSTGQWNNIWVKPGGKITAHGTQANPIIFKRLDSGTQWSQIGLQSSEENSFEWVVFDGGNKTIGVASQNNTFKHCTFKNGVRGISGWHNQGGTGQSHATISYSMVENNSTVGVVAEYADLEMFHTEIRSNGQAGLYVHSSTVYPFHRNEIYNNGTSSSRDGIEITSSGNIILQDSDGSQPTPGYNVISNNSDDQISVSGQATLGLVLNEIGGYNKITGEFITSGRYLVDNNSASSVQAKKNYWGQTSVDSRMFDGDLWDEDDILYFDPTSSQNPGAGGLHPKTMGQENGFLTVSDLYEKHKEELETATNTRDIRYHLSQMFLASRVTKRNHPEVDQSFKQYLVQSVDANRSWFSEARLNKVLRDASHLYMIKSRISDGDYAEAAEHIDQVNANSLDGIDRLDYYHTKISTETYAGNYKKAYQALQQYYLVAEQLNMDMSEVRALNSVIEEDLAELLGRQGIHMKDIVLETLEVGLSAYPNPFNPSTYISFSIPNQAYVILTVYDLLGREVAQLLDDKRNAGSYNIYFDASDLASGVYLYKLSFDNEVITKTMTLIK